MAKITDIDGIKIDYASIDGIPQAGSAISLSDGKISVIADDSTIKVIGGKLSAVGGGGGSAPVKIYDNDDDTEYSGKLWLTPNGEIEVECNGYSYIEVYYSAKDTSDIQCFKTYLEMITSPKTNVGMFYVMDTSHGTPMFAVEQVTCEITESEPPILKVKTRNATASSSIVKIERIYGGV